MFKKLIDKNVILRREFKEDKLGILDILAEVDGNKQVNIELQLLDKNNTIERMLYHWSRLYSRKIRKGGEYKELPKTIVILISNFRIKELGIEDYYTKWQIMETTRKIVLTEIAKELLKESFPTDKISKITGLTEEEIENMKNM